MSGIALAAVVSTILIFLTVPLAKAEDAECHIDSSAPFRAEAFNPILKEVKSVVDGTSLKNRTDLDHYMECFGDRDHTDFKKYKETYSKYLERASKAFGLPYQLLACLFFVESKWNSKRKSGIGAIGLAQLVPTTSAAEITKKLSREDKSKSLRARDERFAQTMKEMKIKSGSDEYEDARKILDAEIKSNSITTMLNQEWKTYWNGNPKRLPGITTADLQTPETALALGAYYLKYIVLNYDMKSNTGFARLLLAAGAYNVGPGKMLEVYHKANPRTFDRIKEIYAAAGNKETAEHLENIYYCAKKGIWTPTDEKDPRKCKAL